MLNAAFRIDKQYLPHAEEKYSCRRIVLKVMKSLGTLLHGHVAGQSPVLEAMLREFLLEKVQCRRELRKHKALG